MSTSFEEEPLTYQGTTEQLLSSAAQRKRQHDSMLGFLSVVFLILVGVGVAVFMLFGLKIQAESRNAPIVYGDCDSKWTTVNRTGTGQKYCHRFFPEKITYEEAEKKCQEHGAHLSGFTGQKMLDEAINKEVRYDGSDNVWIGARRRDACSTREGIGEKEGGFNSDPTHPCSRSRVFEWVNDVAPNPPDFHNLWITDIEPSFAGDVESCVVMMKGAKNIPNWPKDIVGDKKLNDVPCDFIYYYFCGKEAPTVKTDE